MALEQLDFNGEEEKQAVEVVYNSALQVGSVGGLGVGLMEGDWWV